MIAEKNEVCFEMVEPPPKKMLCTLTVKRLKTRRLW